MAKAKADYRCPGCGTVVEYEFDMRVGAVLSAPYHQECECYFEWIPFCRFDVKTDGDGNKGGFQKFSVHRQVMTPDGPKQEEVVIDSLHTLRRIERESEQAHRNGEGEKLAFRAYSNEPTNKDVGLFGAFVPEDTKLQKSGRVSVKAITPADGSEPTVTTGPGMHGSPLSPIDE